MEILFLYLKSFIWIEEINTLYFSFIFISKNNI